LTTQELKNLSKSFPLTDPFPVLFLGHGSPMNAIEENEFTKGWHLMGTRLPKPKAILCISAHWETRGTWITAMDRPRTIHDFGGFPPELYGVQYPAPGSPELALEIKKRIDGFAIDLDSSWGLDHGAWSVILHLFPLADIPVLQLSLDYTKSPVYHFDLARELKSFRERGILIIASGNMVHNLRMMDWGRDNQGFDWAIDSNSRIKDLILKEDYKALINYNSLGPSFKLSIPSAEHYLPLLYALALKSNREKLEFFNEKLIMGSISMTSVFIGN